MRGLFASFYSKVFLTILNEKAAFQYHAFLYFIPPLGAEEGIT